MFAKILVPLDKSLLAESVLPHVISIAAATKGEVILLHVMEEAPSERDVKPDVLDLHLRRAEAEAYLEDVAQRLEQKGVKAEGVVRAGKPARQIVRFLHEERCDLVVLASHGQSGLERWNLSGVVQKIIQVAKTSFLLVRAYHAVTREPRIGYERILVALDGSPRAELSLTPATTIANFWNAELLLAHIVLRPHLFTHGPITPDDKELSNRLVERNLAAAADYLAQVQSHLDVPSQVRLRAGDNTLDAWRKIHEEDEVNLLVCTAHGQGCNRERLYGGMVNTCLNYGCVDMLVLQDLDPDDIILRHAEEAARVWEEEPRQFLAHEKRE